jgi:hypothetical protein
MSVLVLLALVANTGSPMAEQRLSDMTALYNQVCLKAFPDDKAVESLMKAQDARELAPDEVKVTMGGDPARGWELKGREATVWVEFPPFHACSVRWNTPPVSDYGVYRAVAFAYESARSGFKPLKPIETDQGPIHIHAFGEQRALPNEVIESLFVIEQNISDPKRRDAGETGIVLRFVHQFMQPPQKGSE